MVLLGFSFRYLRSHLRAYQFALFWPFDVSCKAVSDIVGVVSCAFYDVPEVTDYGSVVVGHSRRKEGSLVLGFFLGVLHS